MIRVKIDATDLQRLMEGKVVVRGGGRYGAYAEVCLADIGFAEMQNAMYLAAEACIPGEQARVDELKEEIRRLTESRQSR